MAGEQLDVSVKLTNQKVQFTGVARDNPPVAFDYAPPLGDGQGYTGLEMLLMSLAGCSGTAVAFLLRKMGKHIDGLEVNARGSRRSVHPMSFETIRLEFIVHSADVSDADMARAIGMSEETYCPVWAMVRNNVQIATEYRVLKTGG